MTTTPTSPWGRGSWLQTFTGRQFWPLDPQPGDVDIADIAHALSLICRYGGHTQRFYSVAEHAVHVSRAVPPEDALRGLLHDAAEAYVGDMVRPLKHHMPEYRQVEWRIIDVIYESLALTGPHYPDSVREADNRILLDERNALLTRPPVAWEQDGLEPLGIEIKSWRPELAEAYFLTRFHELTYRR